MARRTKAEAEQTRERLLDIAETLFAARGLGATSLEDIARAADLTRGAVYWHFDNKYALFDAIYARAKQPLNDMMEAAITAERPLESLEATCVYSMKQMARDERMQNVFRITQFGCDKSRPEEEMHCRTMAVARVEKILKQARIKGELASHVKIPLAVDALFSYLNGIYVDFLRNGFHRTMERDAKSLARYFFDGLRPRG